MSETSQGIVETIAFICIVGFSFLFAYMDDIEAWIAKRPGVTLMTKSKESGQATSAPNDTKNPADTPCPKLASICLEVDKLRDLLVSKNRDYGASAFESPSLLPGLMPNAAILVRMSDKINRLQTLSYERITRQVANETFDDTIRDLAGYCILYLASVREKEERS